MDELTVDLRRLKMLVVQPTGLEAFSATTRVSDFIRYYFARFLRNLTQLFVTFGHSELATYRVRYKRQIEQTFQTPSLDLSALLVAIPQGMQASYAETVELFDTLLDRLGATTLIEELTELIRYFETPTGAPLSSMSVPQLAAVKSSLEHAFSPHGLLVRPAHDVLRSLGETAGTYTKLLTLTQHYYPQVIALSDLLRKLERSHSTANLTSAQTTQLQQALLHLAERLTLFAAVMTKVQVTEHAFVRALDTLRQQAAKTT